MIIIFTNREKFLFYLALITYAIKTYQVVKYLKIMLNFKLPFNLGKKFFFIIVKSLRRINPALVPEFEIIRNSAENFHIRFADGQITEVNSFPCSIQIR